MLTSCLSEIERYGDPTLADGRLPASTFCRCLLDIIMDLRDTYVYNLMEGEVRTSLEKPMRSSPPYEVETELLSRLTITSHTLNAITHDLIAYGEKIQEYRQKSGKLPRSFLHKLGVFLQIWTTIEMDQYIKLVVDAAQGKNPRIEAYCLDPSVGSEVFAEVHSSIHMSGTLEPLAEYRDSLGLPSTTPLATYPSPFPGENRIILYSKDVTTRYEDLAQRPLDASPPLGPHHLDLQHVSEEHRRLLPQLQHHDDVPQERRIPRHGQPPLRRRPRHGTRRTHEPRLKLPRQRPIARSRPLLRHGRQDQRRHGLPR